MSGVRDQGGYAEYVERMKQRTKGLALGAIRMVRTLPREETARVLGRQILRSATSVGANYRAACRIRTAKEFAAKLRIVCEEADETQYWCELLTESGIMPAATMKSFQQEATELTAILTRALETTRQKLNAKNVRR
jgi:four helix bundle protein